MTPPTIAVLTANQRLSRTLRKEYDDAQLATTVTTRDAAGTIADQRITRRNGLGLVRQTEACAEGGLWDIVVTQYDVLDRAWKRSRPLRSGEVTTRC